MPQRLKGPEGVLAAAERKRREAFFPAGPTAQSRFGCVCVVVEANLELCCAMPSHKTCFHDAEVKLMLIVNYAGPVES